eukprot:6133213-Heterocapsa_arctica.AAC.1
MPVAAAAVSRAVPLGGVPEVTPREQKEMADATINGRRKTSADAEFRRCVKNNCSIGGDGTIRSMSLSAPSEP